MHSEGQMIRFRAYCRLGYKMCFRAFRLFIKTRCMKQRNYVVDILALTFALGAWISVTGFWVELPILIAHLPEGWRISSQLSVAIQLANIGPVIIGTISWHKKGEGDERGLSLSTRRCTIYSLLILGVIANIVLAFEWNATIVIGGYSHSLALILLLFSVGLIGCTSPVLFMPLMAIFPQKYLVSYLVGEGLGGFLPSMVALIQGVEESSNNTNVSSISSAKDSLPLFGPTVYFLFIASIMLISTGSFFLLNNLPISKKEMMHFLNSDAQSLSSSNFMEDCNGSNFSSPNEAPQITDIPQDQMFTLGFSVS
ncbi:hypothetical protein J437_LFUL004709 [Ladona fulva]|uniref:Riboflavin transporter n=1 Tax=Ladona fulva TaxID=123851 RepID=A0A8K0KRM4_LADFU|nr:hypothetical protein J437_LFUL004709 [Ladona fulva]